MKTLPRKLVFAITYGSEAAWSTWKLYHCTISTENRSFKESKKGVTQRVRSFRWEEMKEGGDRESEQASIFIDIECIFCIAMIRKVIALLTTIQQSLALRTWYSGSSFMHGLLPSSGALSFHD